MKIVERNELDVNRWDALVADAENHSFFSFSWYLDAVAENWCVLVDPNYTKGIALPYTKRAGVKVLYIPVFGRFVTAIGSINSEDVACINKTFAVRELATSNELFSQNEKKVYQVIPAGADRKLSSQGKRSLKKAEKCALQVRVTSDPTNVLKAIEAELAGKFSGVDSVTIGNLRKLFTASANENHIKVFEVQQGDAVGGIVCLVDDTQVLYVKGACSESLKQNGGMYLALDSAIEFARENNLLFDFGGSNIEGVRRFNQNLGGTDRTYFFHRNEGPGWFKWSRKLKKRLRG